MQLEGPTAAGLMYSDTGGDGPVVVLLHGVLMGGTLWDTVVGGLRDDCRCIVPELPFGAHTTPMPDDADLTLPALATMIAGFLTELDLRHVTVVCNDWGGAQLVISPGGTDRVANLVLVSCEAFDNYPPGVPGRLLCGNAALPGGTFLTAQMLRPRWIRRLPVTFGALSKRRVPEGLFRSWIGPLSHNPKVRRDLPPHRPQTPTAARVGRPATHLHRPGPHPLGTTRQTHAPHPRRTTRRTLPEHTTRVDRRQPNPHPPRPTERPNRPRPDLPHRAHVTPAGSGPCDPVTCRKVLRTKRRSLSSVPPTPTPIPCPPTSPAVTESPSEASVPMSCGSPQPVGWEAIAPRATPPNSSTAATEASNAQHCGSRG